MNKPNPNYQAIYLCENILNHDGEIGLLHLDFPRCFVRFKDDMESYFSDYDFWKENLAFVNWLDPQYKYTDEEKEKVLINMWNFLCEQEMEEERRYENGYE